MTTTDYIERFKQITQHMVELTGRKGQDYSGLNDPFRNFNLIEILTEGRISTAAGILVRLTDKLQRVSNLMSRPAAVLDEKIEDTILDNAVYSIILYIWLTRDKSELFGVEPAVTPEPAEEPLPEGVNSNTFDEAYELLIKKVESLGIASLSPSENVILKMLISAKLTPGAE